MNNIFDREFYPTPPQVIKMMVEPYAERLGRATILEPSAGKGDILDFITKKGIDYKVQTGRGKDYLLTATAKPEKVYAIERNPELQMIIQQKGYKVIASDFLTFTPEHRFNLILMNPSFSNGDDHLLHAWDILAGGDIACLLNAETIRNPFSAARKRLEKIIAQHGSVEFIGQVFKAADNPTNVEIALVRLHKEPEDDPFKIELEGCSDEVGPDFGNLAQESDSVMVNNQLDAYIRCWDKTKEAAVDFIKAFARLRFFAQSLIPQNEMGENALEHILKSLGQTRYSKENMTAVYNDFLDSIKSMAWGAIFDQIGLGKYMTTGLRRKLDEFRTAQGAMQISKENIFTLFRFIMANIGTIMDQSIVEVYDMFTRYFEGNTSHEEGWKTNRRFKCNRKVILPYAVECGWKPQTYGYDAYFSLSSRAHYGSGRLDDIDKAMCWLTGRNFDSLVNSCNYGSGYRAPSTENHSLAAAITTIPVGDQGWHDSAFFRIRAFKKGTIHLEFKDEALWARFNLAVNEGKNQIGMAE